MTWSKPNPDDRSNNVERLQSMVQNTIDNIEKAEATMAHATGEERAKIEQKNHNREVSIEAMRNEIQDESKAREEGYPNSTN
ncbi:small acid-soluble spore protein Tlp [Priestia aryabhattai]|uniref:small acid-soluble spore protein Tlp n=1 Tax=Bacillaceae TaxID=186817 RepID=UPI000BA09C93|nr:small acid-soluble spore protein Tlp [Bacillus sp. CBEL-1]OZT14474.1 small acid-soluble spore protein Tlp [Priestia aryabhattai]TDB54716.1 small acid-soluble spore protein Tlp [Bacillus sp. CBEL-1]USY56932.1 small acid-soluble spore protein Tlp [Bacillus sp. 1780r2a1]